MYEIYVTLDHDDMSVKVKTFVIDMFCFIWMQLLFNYEKGGLHKKTHMNFQFDI